MVPFHFRFTNLLRSLRLQVATRMAVGMAMDPILLLRGLPARVIRPSLAAIPVVIDRIEYKAFYPLSAPDAVSDHNGQLA